LVAGWALSSGRLLSDCMTTSAKSPYLSVVAVSRNDDHGGDPLRRTQLFINSLAWQAKRYALPVELVLVDWNPPENKAGLADVLQFPVSEHFSARVIVVPPVIHAAFSHGDRLPLFQMIGKNVGIRRAAGEFILATNIDILLDDALFEMLAGRSLAPDRMYRADRFDVENVPDADHAAMQAYCRSPEHHVRRNFRAGFPNYAKAQARDPFFSAGLVDPAFLAANASCLSAVSMGGQSQPLMEMRAEVPFSYLATNACGDFTLMHREAWAGLRGYGEFEAFSMHIDSIGCVAAHYAGFRETSFLPPAVCYHIEHSYVGIRETRAGGYKDDEWGPMYGQMAAKGLPCFEFSSLVKELLEKLEAGTLPPLNSEDWGLRPLSLEETVFNREGRALRPANECWLQNPAAAFFGPLSVLDPRFEVDRVFASYIQSTVGFPEPNCCFVLIKLPKYPYYWLVRSAVRAGNYFIHYCLHCLIVITHYLRIIFRRYKKRPKEVRASKWSIKIL